jgi:hypothetical protein
MELSELLALYEKEHGRRAHGGLWALSGFDFQLRLHLAVFVEALVKREDIHGAGAHFAHALEGLSDYTGRHGAGWKCVQVKRTLRGGSSGSLAAAAVEFAVIEGFLRKHLADGELPKYEVAGWRWEGAGHWSLDAIELPKEVRDKSPDLVEWWREIRDQGRLLPLRVDPDPSWRLLAAVFPVMEQPFEFARAALEIGLRRYQMAPEAGRNEIAELFKKMEARRLLSNWQILGDEDFKPDSREKLTSLRVGHQPSLKLCRNRQYMPRAAHVEAASSELEQVLALREHRDTSGLQVFWINGRSGAGKSVLLIQVMEEMSASFSSVRRRLKLE